MSIAQDEGYSCYVSNLAPLTTGTCLRLAFEKYWPVINARVIKDRDGVSRGFGFVDLESMEHVEDAISRMNGEKIHGSAIMVTEANRNLYDYRDRRVAGNRGNAAAGQRWRIREKGEHPVNEDGIASGQGSTNAVCWHCGDPGHTVSQCSAIYDSRTWPRYSRDTYNPTLWPPRYGTDGSSSQPPPPPPPPPLSGHGYDAYGSSSEPLLPLPLHGYVAYGSSSQPLLPQPPHGYVAYGSSSQPLLPLPPPPHGYVAYGSSSQPQPLLPLPLHGYVAYGSSSQPLLQQQQPPPGNGCGSSSQPLLQQQQPPPPPGNGCGSSSQPLLPPLPPPGTYGPGSVPSMHEQEPPGQEYDTYNASLWPQLQRHPQ